MSELPASALTTKPQDGVHQSMCLQLQNNNDFLKSSSASAASSSSSPDSTYSLSSLDVELPEGLMGRKAAISEDDSGIQSPDCRPDDNDNSVSVYLDANEEGWHAECDDQDNVTIIQNRNHDNVFSDAGDDREQGRRGSGDSSATEAQLFSSENEEGEDEEDDSFLSLRSADVVTRKQSEPEDVQMCSSNKRCVNPVIELHQEAFQDSVDHPKEEVQMCSSTTKPTVDPVNKVPHEAFQDSVDPPSDEGQMTSSTMRPSMGLVSELHQETSHDFYNDKSEMQTSTKGTDMNVGSELHHEAPQESLELHKTEEQMKCSNRSLDVGSVSQEVLQDSGDQYNEQNQIQISAKRPNVDLVSELHQEAVQKTIDLSTEKSPAQPPAELILNQTISPSVSQSTPIQNIEDPPYFPKRIISQNTNDPPDLPHTRFPIKPPNVKFTKVALKRFSRPNLKDVKPKVISRATSTPRPRNADHSQSAVGCDKNSQTTRSRSANRRHQGDDGVKKNRTSIQSSVTTPITISDSDSKSTMPTMVKNPPPEFPGTKVLTNGCYAHMTSSNVPKTVRDEKEEEKVVEKETSRNGDEDQVSSSSFFPPNNSFPPGACAPANHLQVVKATRMQDLSFRPIPSKIPVQFCHQTVSTLVVVTR